MLRVNSCRVVQTLLDRDESAVRRSLLVRRGGWVEVPAALAVDAEIPAGVGVVPMLQLHEAKDTSASVAALTPLQPAVVLARLELPRADHTSALERLGELYDAADAHGLTCVVETRRGTPLGDPWRTAALLRAEPRLRLALHLAEWIVTAERHLLGDEAVALAARRTSYVCAGVGAPQSAVLADPRAVAARPSLEAHLAVWRKVGAAARLTAAPLWVAPRYEWNELLADGAHDAPGLGGRDAVESFLVERAAAAVAGRRGATEVLR